MTRIDHVADTRDRSSGLVATIGELGGTLDDGSAMFGIATARAGAWQVSPMMWDLVDHARLDEVFRTNLARTSR
jgi:hypothetical protein